MRHLRPEDLPRLARVLQAVRAIPGLAEKSPAAFYWRGKAFLHFHEHDGAYFADIRDRADWRRLPLNTIADERALCAAAARATAKPRSAPKTPPPARPARPRR